MPTLKSKSRKNQTQKNQRGGGFLDIFKQKLSNFNIPNPFNQVKANFNSLISGFQGSICPPCPKSENVLSQSYLPKQSINSENKPRSQTQGGKNHKKRKTTKKRVIKNKLN